MDLKRFLTAFVISAVLSAGAWLVLRDPIGRGVRAVTARCIEMAGGRVVYPSQSTKADAGRATAGNAIGLAIATRTEGGRRRIRSYGISLMRWHVNLIVLPVLIMSLGTLALRRRLVMLVVGVPLLMILDGVAAFLYMRLGARRILGDEIVSTAVHGNLEHALAIYAMRLLPFALWGGLYLIARRGALADRPAGL